jgi:hypothetical protein
MSAAEPMLGPLWWRMAAMALPIVAIEIAYARRLPLSRGRVWTGVAVGNAASIGLGVPCAWWLYLQLAALLPRTPPTDGVPRWNALAVLEAAAWLPGTAAQPSWLPAAALLILLVPCLVVSFVVEFALGLLLWPGVSTRTVAGTTAIANLRSFALLFGVAAVLLLRAWWQGA